MKIGEMKKRYIRESAEDMGIRRGEVYLLEVNQGEEEGHIYLRLDRERGYPIVWHYESPEKMAQHWEDVPEDAEPVNHPERRKERKIPDGDAIRLRYIGHPSDDLKFGEVLEANISTGRGKIFLSLFKNSLILVYTTLQLFNDAWEDE